jgi:hypothetical protein
VFASSELFFMKQPFINTIAYRRIDEPTMKETGALMKHHLVGMKQ